MILSSIVSKSDVQGLTTYINKPFEEISKAIQKMKKIRKNHNIIRHPDTPKEVLKIYGKKKKIKIKNLGLGKLK